MIDNTRPAYRILAPSGFYGPDDNLYIENEHGYAEIYLDGEPNEEMEPLNEPARVKMQAYLDKLENLGRAAAEKAGKAYAGRPRNLDGGLELATAVARSSMPIMSVQRDVTTIERIDTGSIPEVGTVNPKRGRGRPPKGVMAVS